MRWTYLIPNPFTKMKDPNRQIFGEEDPMHKSISFADRLNESYLVTAVIEDLPPNSHLYLKALLPFNSLRDSAELAIDPWVISIDGSAELYVRLNESGNAKQLAAKAIPLLRKNISESGGDRDKEYVISLQSLADIYLSPAIYAEYCAKGNITYIYVFVLLGIFLLVIASINYVNLSIADFHKRSKEIGVRKVLGARKKQLAIQVIVEACLISFSSLILSISVLYFLFPRVLQSLDDNLRFIMLFEPTVMILIALTVLLLIVFSTAYPAYRLAVNNLSNDLKSGNGFGKNGFCKNTHYLVGRLLK